MASSLKPIPDGYDTINAYLTVQDGPAAIGFYQKAFGMKFGFRLDSPPGKVQKLKGPGGPEIQVHGSGNLFQILLKNDLVDELRLKIFPITLGAGKRLFGEGTLPAEFELLKSAHSPTGVIVATSARAGEVKNGSFALAVPTEAELARRQRLMEEN